MIYLKEIIGPIAFWVGMSLFAYIHDQAEGIALVLIFLGVYEILLRPFVKIFLSNV